jgi:hypothetical protein
MQKSTQIFATCSTSKTSHATYAPIVANALSAPIFAERLNAFIAQRTRLAGHLGGAEEVIAFFDLHARTEGLESACELLDLATKFGDFNIVDYEIYKELIATSSDILA